MAKPRLLNKEEKEQLKGEVGQGKSTVDTDVGKKLSCSQSWGPGDNPSVTKLCARPWGLPQPPARLHFTSTVCTPGPQAWLLSEMPLLW